MSVYFPFTLVSLPLLTVVLTCSILGQTKAIERFENITVRTHEGTELSFDVTPDGKLVVFDLLGQLWSLPASGGNARALTDAVRDVAEDADPSISPDGRFILFRGERRGRTGIWLLGLPEGTITQLTQLSDPDGFDGQAAWSPDGRFVVFMHSVSPDPSVGGPRRLSPFILDVTAKAMKELSVSGLPSSNISSPMWLKDGDRIAFVIRHSRRDKGGRIWAVSSSGGQAVPLSPQDVEVREPALSTNGSQIAYFGVDKFDRTQIWILDLMKGKSLKVTNHNDVTTTRIRWIPNKSELLYSADGKMWTVRAEGGKPKEIPFTAELSIRRPQNNIPQAHFPEPGKSEPARGFMGLAISPDGSEIGMLALGKFWIIPINGKPQAVADVPFEASNLAWSPDANEVAWSAGIADHEDLFATNTQTGETRQLTALPGREAYPAYSPDGTSIAFLHISDGTVLRTIEAHGEKVTDVTKTNDLKSIGPNGTCPPQWSPRSDALLVCGGTASNEHAVLVQLNADRKTIDRFPNAPIFLQWTPDDRIFYVRHDRLWQARFDGLGTSNPSAVGDDAALYMSSARDGTLLYVSDGGLKVRTPSGTVQRIGWPLSFVPPVADRTLLQNVRIVSDSDGFKKNLSDILIENGRITRIETAGRIADRNARLIDVRGRFVIPGMFDLHAHIYRPDLTPGYLYFGITTIRDQGSSIGPLVSYAADIASGSLPGPRFAYGGFQYYSDWAFDEEQGRGIEPEADPQHIKRALDLSEAFGAQHIKTRTFRRWDINARMIEEAHRRGMRTTGHCSHLLPLIAAGMDAKEHIGMCEARGNTHMYSDLIQLFKAAHIGVVPTITYLGYAVQLSERPELLSNDAELLPFLPDKENFGWMTGMPAEARAEWSKLVQYSREEAVKLLKAGVIVGTGTDIWQNPIGVHMELEQMVASGISPRDALRAATLDAARILGAEKDLGSIEVGKRADMVVLDADPIADIRNTRKIWNVFQDGRLVDRASILSIMKPK